MIGAPVPTNSPTSGNRSETSPSIGATKALSPTYDSTSAKLKQAEAARAAAEAQNAKAIKGAREQEITAAYEMWQKAQAGLTIAKKSFDRIQNLYEKGVMSAQKRDEVEANYNAMVATEKAARSQYEMAKEGARKEDKAAAAACFSFAINSGVSKKTKVSPAFT